MKTVILGAIGLAAAVAVWMLIPLEGYIRSFAAWIAGLGALGPGLFGLAYVAVTLALGPAWMLSVAAGVAFGFWGLALVLPSALAGAAAGYVVARWFGRERIAPYLERWPRLEAVDRALARHGFKVVLLLRLNPAIPFGVKNYLLGLSGVSLPTYLAGTCVGIMPGAFVYVYFGAVGRRALDRQTEPLEWLLIGAGLVATLVAVLIIRRAAVEELRRMGVVAKQEHPRH